MFFFFWVKKKISTYTWSHSQDKLAKSRRNFENWKLSEFYENHRCWLVFEIIWDCRQIKISSLFLERKCFVFFFSHLISELSRRGGKSSSLFDFFEEKKKYPKWKIIFQFNFKSSRINIVKRIVDIFLLRVVKARKWKIFKNNFHHFIFFFLFVLKILMQCLCCVFFVSFRDQQYLAIQQRLRKLVKRLYHIKYLKITCED